MRYPEVDFAIAVGFKGILELLHGDSLRHITDKQTHVLILFYKGKEYHQIIDTILMREFISALFSGFVKIKLKGGMGIVKIIEEIVF